MDVRPRVRQGSLSGEGANYYCLHRRLFGLSQTGIHLDLAARLRDGDMHIFVDAGYLREVWRLEVQSSDTIANVKAKIEDQEGVLVDEQRLLLDGWYLRDSDTLATHNIADQCKLELFKAQRGMISTFTATDTADPLVSYLMLTETERAVASIPTEHLIERSCNAGVCQYQTFKFIHVQITISR